MEPQKCDPPRHTFVKPAEGVHCLCGAILWKTEYTSHKQSHSGAPSDVIDPIDSLLMQLKSGPSAEELPDYLQCPSGHQTWKYLIPIANTGVNIPVYVCDQCMVVFRYQECRLIPGDEG